MNVNAKMTVLIATFSPWKLGKRLPINGNVEPMLDFFTPKAKKTVLIDQPYTGSDSVMPRIEVYEKGKKPQLFSSGYLMYILYPFLKITNYEGTHVTFKLRDFFSVIDWTLREKNSIDIFIGFEAINALAGIMLKKLGKIKIVVYYVSDFTPIRYKQLWFNRLYLWLDRFCAMHADYIWDVSRAMQPARIAAGLKSELSAPELHVPNALYPKQIHAERLQNTKPYSLVFMGTLGPDNGPDLAIRAMPDVLKKFPQARLHVVGGGGGDVERLQKLVQFLHIKKFVIFHGFVSDREKLSSIIRKFRLALAPYVARSGSGRWYGDATKIRAYVAAGLPTITTPIPPLGKEIAEFGAGIIVEDNPKAIARAIIRVFSDMKLYRRLREQAIKFSRNNTWENEFSRAFRAMRKK